MVMFTWHFWQQSLTVCYDFLRRYQNVHQRMKNFSNASMAFDPKLLRIFESKSDLTCLACWKIALGKKSFLIVNIRLTF